MAVSTGRPSLSSRPAGVWAAQVERVHDELGIGAAGKRLAGEVNRAVEVGFRRVLRAPLQPACEHRRARKIVLVERAEAAPRGCRCRGVEIAGSRGRGTRAVRRDGLPQESVGAVLGGHAVIPPSAARRLPARAT
jgi:hypothetical protein